MGFTVPPPAFTCDTLYARLVEFYTHSHQMGSGFLPYLPSSKPEIAFDATSVPFDRLSMLLLGNTTIPQAAQLHAHVAVARDNGLKAFHEFQARPALPPPTRTGSLTDRVRRSPLAPDYDPSFQSLLSILCYLDVDPATFNDHTKVITTLLRFPTYEAYFEHHAEEWENMIVGALDKRWPELKGDDWAVFKTAIAHKVILPRIKERFIIVEPGKELRTFLDDDLVNSALAVTIAKLRKNNYGPVAEQMLNAEVKHQTDIFWHTLRRRSVNRTSLVSIPQTKFILSQVQGAELVVQKLYAQKITDWLEGKSIIKPSQVFDHVVQELSNLNDVSIGKEWVYKKYPVTTEPTERDGLAMGGFCNSVRFQTEETAAFCIPIESVGLDGAGNPYVMMKRHLLVRTDPDNPKIRGILDLEILRGMDEKTKLWIALNFVKPLKLCHEGPNPIIHGDIKYTNVVIRSLHENGDIEFALIDFDVAMYLSEVDKFPTDVQPVFGTYLPPEAGLGNHTPNFTVDTFAMGCALYEIFTGTELPTPKSPLDVPYWNYKIDYNHPDVPKALRDIIRKATHRDPEERYQSGSHLFDDIEKAFKELLTKDTNPEAFHPTIPPPLSPPNDDDAPDLGDLEAVELPENVTGDGSDAPRNSVVEVDVDAFI